MLVDQRTGEDCLRACLATVFGLTYEQTPDPLWGGAQWRARLYGWVSERFGLTPWEFALGGEDKPKLRYGSDVLDYHFSWPGIWIAQVKSPRIHGTHAVVMRGNQLLHDPHPKRVEGHLGFREAMVFMPRSPGSILAAYTPSAVSQAPGDDE